MNKFVFWSVDCQKDFMDADGKLYVEGAESIKINIAKMNSLASMYGEYKVFTKDWHTNASRELSDDPDFINTFPPHCLSSENGSSLIDELSGEEFEECTTFTPESVITEKDFDNWCKKTIFFLKDNFDVFEGANSTQLGNLMADSFVRSIDVDTYVVYGVATNVCVNFAVKGLCERGKNVIVVVDAIKELPGIPLDNMLQEWRNWGVEFVALNLKQIDGNAVYQWVVERTDRGSVYDITSHLGFISDKKEPLVTNG